MDQIKIGQFIATRRKIVGLTQAQLAEKLGITDRAVSKWETGKSMPDSSVMLSLCELLGITVTDLLKGEITKMETYHKELENNLLEMIRQKEQADKRLLKMEIVMGIVCLIPLLGAICLVAAIQLKESVEAIIVLLSLLPLLIATPFAIRIEQKAGYYMCELCGHRYKPQYKNVFLSMHLHRTRYMRCPNCGKRSWQKKTVHKE